MLNHPHLPHDTQSAANTISRFIKRAFPHLSKVNHHPLAQNNDSSHLLFTTVPEYQRPSFAKKVLKKATRLNTNTTIEFNVPSQSNFAESSFTRLTIEK